jgi:hypothetical protein
MIRYAAVALVGLGLASCDVMPEGQGVAIAPDRQAAFVALIEQSDCRFDPVNHEPVHAAGFTDPEISEIGGQLVAQGQAEIAPNGDLILLTGTCL